MSNSWDSSDVLVSSGVSDNRLYRLAVFFAGCGSFFGGMLDAAAKRAYWALPVGSASSAQ